MVVNVMYVCDGFERKLKTSVLNNVESFLVSKFSFLKDILKVKLYILRRKRFDKI